MKAHRREAKNCALIECAQVAAEKANWPLRDEFRRMSSRQGRRRGARRRSRGPHARAGASPAATRAPAGTPQRVAYERPTPAAPPPRTAPPAPRSAPPPPAAVAGRIDPRSAALFFRLRHQEALIMAKHRGRGVATINYPIGMNLGGDPSQALVHSNPDRQIHRRPVLDRSWARNEIGDAADLRRDARRPGRGRLCRHRRFRHRPALHGIVRVARNASRRQCGDGGGARSPRRHDGSSGGRA